MDDLINPTDAVDVQEDDLLDDDMDDILDDDEDAEDDAVHVEWTGYI